MGYSSGSLPEVGIRAPAVAAASVATVFTRTDSANGTVAAHFTVVAPDSPGYGLSDPLGVDTASLDDFADASIEFMDAIGAKCFGIYGFHTGGMIGIAIADRYPDRVTALACNGVVVPTDTELGDILQTYLPPLEPRWDGGHLTWLWARTREQTVFFPWHNRSLAARMDFPMPNPEHQQNSVLEFLRAGRHYRVAYRAAFEFHAENVIPRLSIPTVITAADWDPLQPHLKRITVPAAATNTVRIVPVATPTEAIEHSLDLLREYRGDDAPDTPRSSPAVQPLWQRIVRTASGEMLVREGNNGAEQVDGNAACVILHAAGGSGTAVSALAAELAQTRRVVVPDLPGHGETQCSMSPNDLDVDDCAHAVSECLATMHLSNVSLIGIGAGAAVALDLAAREPELVSRCVLIDLPLLDPDETTAWLEHGLPSMAPEWSGGHLLRCWHMVRDGRLYFPWFRRDRDTIIWQEPELDDSVIHLEVTELLKSEGYWQALLGAQLQYPLTQQLSQLPIPVACASVANSCWYPATRKLATAAGVTFAELPGAVAEQALAISALFAASHRQ